MTAPPGEQEDTGTADSAPLQPLRRNRDFVLLWGGVGATLLGARACYVAYPFLVLWYTGSASDAGLVGFAALLPNLLVQLPAGALVDRWDRRRLMILCDLGSLLATASVAAAVATGRINLGHLVAAAFVSGSLAVFHQLAERAAVRHLVPPGQLPVALTQNEARWRAAGLLGQPVGGALYTLARWSPFLFAATAHLLSLISLLLIRKPFQGPRDTAPRRRLAVEVAEGFTWTWQRRFLTTLVGLIAATNLLFQGISLAVILIVRDGGGSAALLGTITAVGGIGGMLGALGATWWTRRAPLRTVVIGSITVWAAVIPLLIVVRAPVLIGALLAVMAYAGGLVNVVGGVYQVSVTPDEMQGRVSSVLTLIASGAGALGALGSGFLLDGLGVTGTLAGIAGCMVLLAVTALVTPALRRPDPAPGEDISAV
ncbi:MFS transporter [Streptomyces sp. NBC_00841]|uniref:MFS transporter n=1 Tax=unclassified Streptomyces TaxID=2593676 RepID=UPI00225AF020|nr:MULTISPECIES: MFS transporter [unclassified Streptomyces]MCX4532017.1 MFS transporter [Streptomyces sp. NBC_01669]WSA02460.1 MFS transporter [Streptomyces sp. NBC_00841]